LPELKVVEREGEDMKLVWEYVALEMYVYSGAWDYEVHKITPAGNNEWKYTGHSGTVRGVAVNPGLHGAGFWP